MTLATRQVHLDFHTGDVPFALGEHFDGKAFAQRLLDSHVNSITLTARDHSGRIYYQSDDFPVHPQLGQRDLLAEEIAAVHSVGIKAPIYLTAGWDAYQAKRHPEWLERHEDGSLYGFEEHGQLDPGWKTLCFNTAYVDYLIAQTKDLLQHFNGNVDGIFYDILWQDHCYCDCCLDMMQDVGLDPRSDADQTEFAQITEQRFKHRLLEAVREVSPDCSVVFNEGNITPAIRPNLSDYDHLEIESLPGGDWGYQHFPVTVRYAKNLGKEYLGMTGRFHNSWGDFGSYRSYPALEYENFLALIHGAKCSIGDQMYPDGSLSNYAYDLIGKVYGKIAKYESLEDDVSAVCDIAVLHPYVLGDGDTPVAKSLAGAVNMLNELHLQFDIIDKQCDWSVYRVLVLPDTIQLDDELEEMVDNYLAKGGRILATGKSGLRQSDNQFPDSWGLHRDGSDDFVPTYFRYAEGNDTEFVIHGEGENVRAVSSDHFEVLASQWQPLYQRDYQHYYGHYQAPIGSQDEEHAIAQINSRIFYISHPLFSLYKQEGNLAYKKLVETGLQRLLNHQRFVEYQGLPTSADVVLNHQPGQHRLVLGMLSYIPQRSATETDVIQDIIPLHDVKVSLNWSLIQKKLGLEKLPKRFWVATSNRELEVKWQSSQATVTVPTINGYEFLVIDY